MKTWNFGYNYREYPNVKIGDIIDFGNNYELVVSINKDKIFTNDNTGFWTINDCYGLYCLYWNGF